MKIRNPLLALAVLAGLSPALAGAKNDYVAIEQRLSAEQRHATGLDTLTPDQLALLNQLLRDSTPTPTPAATPARADGAPKERVLMGLEDGPIKGKLKGTISGWEPGTVFELEDGQRWKVLKGSLTLRKPLVAPDVLVVPGVAGRWFLQVDEDLPKARVYRID
jgi:hypothetical protein